VLIVNIQLSNYDWYRINGTHLSEEEAKIGKIGYS
jgi:hypothetical protein